MKEVFKGVAGNFTVGQAIDYYEQLGIAVVVNDGKNVTLEIEKPLASKHKGQM